MANEKSKAEQYRDERKARIAKTAKKNAHNMEKKNTAKKIAGKVISIVVCVAIVLGIVAFSFNYYGVLQRVIKIGSVGTEQSVTIAEYEYYYMRAYNEIRYQAQYYQYYYSSDIGYDTSLAPDEQTQTTTDDEGNEISWVERLHDDTIDLIQIHKAYYNEALKAGLELTQADEAYIDQQIEELREEASGSDSDSDDNTTKYSLNAYLRKVYGGAVNERFLRKQLKIQTLAQKFVTERTAEIAKGYEQSAIDKKYNEATSDYDFVTFRTYTFTAKELTAEDGESDEDFAARQSASDAEVKKNANDFLAAVKDEATFAAKVAELNKDTEDYDVDAETKYTMLKSSVESNISEDAATWLYDKATKAGDKKLFTDEDNGKYTIVLAVAAPHQEQTVTVRHILLATQDTSSGEALSDEEVAEKKATADDVLKKFNESDKSEDAFAALAYEYTEDSGSSSTGGLYEHIYPGQMVTEFNDWCFDDSRQAGDVEMVETDYGYHIIYFVEDDGADYYDSTIRENDASEDFETEAQELISGNTYHVFLGDTLTPYSEDQALKKIKYLVELNNASSSSY